MSDLHIEVSRQDADLLNLQAVIRILQSELRKVDRNIREVRFITSHGPNDLVF